MVINSLLFGLLQILLYPPEVSFLLLLVLLLLLYKFIKVSMYLAYFANWGHYLLLQLK